jgi:hypothetical protein
MTGRGNRSGLVPQFGHRAGNCLTVRSGDRISRGWAGEHGREVDQPNCGDNRNTAVLGEI